jgi:hypothetical protein
VLINTETVSIFERDRDTEGGWCDDWSTERGHVREGVGVEDDEDGDGFSDRATQGTEIDVNERDAALRSPVEEKSEEISLRSPGRRASVRRFAFGCADLIDD